MGIVKEFKSFIMKGNVVDMAVGIIIGAAFGAVVKSLVDNVMMPPIGYLMGGIDFSSFSYEIAPAVPAVLDEAGKVVTAAKDPIVLKYGAFLNSIIALLIQGMAVFSIVKVMNQLHKKEEAAPAPPPADVVLLTEIRDLLKK